MKKLAIGTALCLFAFSLFAQPALRLPDASPAATVGETNGVTDVHST